MRRLAILITAFWTILILSFVFVHKAKAGVPEQAQASNLAVPGQEAELPFAGAIVITQCKSVIGLVMIKHDGAQQPVELKGLTPRDVTTLLQQAPSEGVAQFDVHCPVSAKGGVSV